MAYIGNSPQFATQIPYRYTIAAAGTTVTGLDDFGKALTYTPGYVAVYVNGVKLIETLDYTASSGSSVVFVNPVQIGDTVEIIAYGTYSLGSASYVQKSGDTVTGDLTVTGNFTVSQTYPFVSVNKPASGTSGGFLGRTNWSTRWGVTLGDAGTEAGGNSGSNFSIDRYNDAGNYVDSPVVINRATGVVTIAGLAAKIGFSAYPSVDQTGVANETWTKVLFQTALFNDSSLYSTSTSRWTPPAGRCQISAAVGFYSTTLLVGTPILFGIYKNGSQYKVFTGSVVSSIYASAGTTIIDSCNGTDYYEINVYPYTNSTATIYGISTWTYFMGTTI